jgi:hypothetical protein
MSQTADQKFLSQLSDEDLASVIDFVEQVGSVGDALTALDALDQLREAA